MFPVGERYIGNILVGFNCTYDNEILVVVEGNEIVFQVDNWKDHEFSKQNDDFPVDRKLMRDIERLVEDLCANLDNISNAIVYGWIRPASPEPKPRLYIVK